MASELVDTKDDLKRQNEKLRKINDVLMRRIERSTEVTGEAYAQFQRAATLEEEVRRRTRDLERALDLLNISNARLSDANKETEAARSDLANAIEAIQEGFAFFSPDDRLVMCNSRFGAHMPDLDGITRPGLSFKDYVWSVSQSSSLDFPDRKSAEDWAEQRLARHQDQHVLFNVQLVGNRWIQVGEHRTPDGGTVVLQTDVTDMMRLERQERDRILDGQARTVQATLDNLNQGVCIFDSSARLVGWNQRAIDLLPLPALQFRIGTRLETLLHGFPPEMTYSGGANPEKILDWAGGADGRPSFNFEIILGESQIIAVDAKDIPENGFVFSLSDISAERAAVKAIRRANEQLEARVTERTLELEDALAEAERANTSKSRFVAAASHDLLQPLSAAKLYLSSVGCDTADSDVELVVRKAESALASVEDILGALLDISKLDSGKAAFHIAPIRLNPVFRQLLDELAPQAVRKGLDLRVVETGAVVMTDATYLRRILQNLISNAIRYTAKGKVLFGVRRAGPSVRVEVWDTGPGIPEEEQETVFGEFNRVNSTVSAAEGMGLGLAIVDRACALLNHPLELRSEVGRGTGFLVTLPRARRFGRPNAGTERQGEHSSSNMGDLIVVLVENDKNVREALEMALQTQWGIGVVSASSTGGAMDAIQDLGVRPDAIIADFQLNEFETGVETVSEIRRQHGKIPACIISADRSPSLSTLCRDEGLEIVHKPIDLDDLGAFLEALTEAGQSLEPAA